MIYKTVDIAGEICHFRMNVDKKEWVVTLKYFQGIYLI